MSVDNKNVENIEAVEEAVTEANGVAEAEAELLKKAKEKDENAVIISEIIAAQRELDELKEEYGLQEEEKGIKKAISKFFDKREAQGQVPIKKKKYLWLAVLLGWMGAHRFYTKQYTTAIVYLLTCWTGFSIAMTIIDLMIVIPKKPDENGNIYLF